MKDVRRGRMCWWFNKQQKQLSQNMRQFKRVNKKETAEKYSVQIQIRSLEN